MPKPILRIILVGAHFSLRRVSKLWREVIDQIYPFSRKDIRSIMKRGNLHVFKLFLRAHPHIGYGSILATACKKNYTPIVRILARREHVSHFHLNRVNSKKTLKLLIQFSRESFDPNMLLGIFCEKGYEDLVDFLFRISAPNPNIGLIHGIYRADLVLKMIQAGARDFHSALYIACAEGHSDSLKIILQHAPELTSEAFEYMCKFGQSILLYLFEKTEDEDLLLSGITAACEERNSRFIIRIIQYYGLDPQLYFESICYFGCYGAAKEFAPRISNLREYLGVACFRGNSKIIKLLRELGADNCPHCGF